MSENSNNKRKVRDQSTQNTIAVYYEQILGDYKRNEQLIMAKLDQIQHNLDPEKKVGLGAAVEATEEIRRWEEHVWATEKLFEKLHSDQNKGLTEHKAFDLFQQLGENALTEKVATPWYFMLLKEFTSFFALLLWGGGILCFIGYGVNPSSLDNIFLAIVLWCVVILTGTFSYLQQSKTASLMADFQNFIPKLALCRREGKWNNIEARLLVPGDLVQVKAGDNIPADLILIQANEMKVNNASLTGESEDLLRNVDGKTMNIFETQNVAFFGTSCTTGNGVGVVFRTGDNTVIGRIAGLASSADVHETTLALEIQRFVKLISAIAIIIGVVFFLFGVFYGYRMVTNIVFAIGIIVANVPEGLLATMTVALALSAKRMATKMVLVKNLESIETLGSASCICSDKTGTLTQNRMTVSQIYCNLKVEDASVNWEIYKRLEELESQDSDETKVRSVPQPRYNTKDKAFRQLVETISLSTTSFFSYKPSSDEIRAQVAKNLSTSLGRLPKDVDKNTDPEMYEEYEKAAKQLIKIEEDKPYVKREVEGDASETGLIKFVQPLLMGGHYGCYKNGGIDGFRKSYPDLAMIPFSSDIKFNLIIRDMQPENKDPENADQNMWVFLKGAPERVIGRCSTVLINGETERNIDDGVLQGVNSANERFGGMGERVLAFARAKLDPKNFKKNPAYPFDVKNWKSWRETREFDDKINGWFPMWNLTLVGMVSLNDPPRPLVDVSVAKCRKAGIKVIMVTGDQPATAAAIAHKVNIITDPNLEYNTILRNHPEMSHEEAWEMARAIVIHGDELAKVHAAEEALDDNEIEKGKIIMDWLSKPEVVFARTTPSQKLLIVDACQKLGHIVAVTGDGVNDSPAIKKADIGIAMGSGSDVAQNAADMIILDDNFSSIVNGIEEGRLIFDNLKKSIAYTLASNIPEIWPFIFFIIIQVPLPLTTILILCIDLGTDMIPAITYAYENPELDIMDRQPRNAKRDFLVGTKLISFSYLQIGMLQQCGGLFIYFFVMNDYGFRPGTLLKLNNELGYFPKDTDVYNPNLPNNGNSNYGNIQFKSQLEWLATFDGKVDVRLFYTERLANSWSKCRWIEGTQFPGLNFYRQSAVTGSQICYTTEALKHAHTAYLVGISFIQWAALIVTKTRTLSISQQGMVNHGANLSLIFIGVLQVLITYVPFLNYVFGTRKLAFPHFALPAFTWLVTVFLYDELRKIFVRTGIIVNADGHTKLKGWVARNTMY